MTPSSIINWSRQIRRLQHESCKVRGARLDTPKSLAHSTNLDNNLILDRAISPVQITILEWADSPTPSVIYKVGGGRFAAPKLNTQKSGRQNGRPVEVYNDRGASGGPPIISILTWTKEMGGPNGPPNNQILGASTMKPSLFRYSPLTFLTSPDSNSALNLFFIRSR